MMKIKGKEKPEEVLKQLSLLGSEGWELVFVTPIGAFAGTKSVGAQCLNRHHAETARSEGGCMNIAKIAIVLTVLVGCTLSGCSTTRWVGVESGEYTVSHGWGEAYEVATRAVQKMEIDRDEGVAVFTLVDGSEIVTSFVPRGRAEWPAGCPANIGSTRMEVLDIEEDTLTIESVTISNAILVRDCPPDPVRIVLREDWEFDACCNACPGPNEKCVYFRPK